jgi:hypothetical protein
MLSDGPAQEAAPLEDPMDKSTNIGSYYQKPVKALSVEALDREKEKFYRIGMELGHVTRT